MKKMNLISITEIFSFLFLVLVGSGLGAEIDNRVTGTPIVECERDFIKVTVPTLKPFQGKIYVKGEYSNEQCVRNYASGNSKPSQKRPTVSNHPDNFDDFRNPKKNNFKNSEKGPSGDLFVQTRNGGFERVPSESKSKVKNERLQKANFRNGHDSFLKTVVGKKEKFSNKVFPDENGECPLVCPPCGKCSDSFNDPSGLHVDDSDLLILTPRRQRRESNSEASLEVRLGTCNARRDRTVNPPGIHVSFTVVVSFHENFITKIDRAYQISCSYEEFDRSVTTQIDVSPPPETDLEGQIDPPRCEYRITSPSGKSINNVLVGETIQHTWICTSGNDRGKLNEAYGILVHNCFVDDGKKNKVKIIDDVGCSIYPEIFGTPEYSTDSVSASIKNLVVKFPDQNSVDYQCSIHTCVRAEGHCDGITPPNCGANRRRRHLEPTWPGNATLQPEEWKLHAQKLTVIDIDNNISEKDIQKLFTATAAAQTSESPIAIDEFCVSVLGFGVIVASSTFLFTVALTVLTGLFCLRKSKSLLQI